MELYLEDENIVDAAAKARKIMRGIDEGLERLDASGLTDDQKKIPTELWTFFENTLKVNVKYRLHLLHLMKYRQQTNESLDAFVIRARTLALKCDFSEEEMSERILELIIANTPHEEFRRDLMAIQ